MPRYRGATRYRSTRPRTGLRWFLFGLIVGGVGIFILLRSVGPSAPVEVVMSTPPSSSTKPPQDLTWTDSGNVGVEKPKEGDTISSPLAINGMARVLENKVYIRLSEERSKEKTKPKELFVLGEATAIIKPSEAGFHGPFETSLTFTSPQTNKGTLEVFGKDKDGKETDLLSISVTLVPAKPAASSALKEEKPTPKP